MLLSRFASASALVALAGEPALADEAPEPSASVDTTAAPADRPKGTFAVGAGFGPDDGFLARAEIVQPDLFRTGQRLALAADVSAIRQRFVLSHDVPDLIPNIDLRSELFGSRRNFGDFTREGIGGQVGLAWKLDRHTKIYGRYRLEAVETTLNPDQATERLTGMSNLGNGTIATLGAGIVHDTLDARFLPLRGTRFEVFAERADRRWGSEYDFERTGGSFDHARALGPLTLRLHGHATYLRSSDPMGVPLSERLQHDGHAEVRGYRLDSLPALGSNFEAVGRVELEVPIWRRAGLSLAGWADAGMRQNTDPMYGSTSDHLLQRSVGLSLIWRSPIGPLRFDVAIPLDGNRDRQYLFGVGGWWW